MKQTMKHEIFWKNPTYKHFPSLRGSITTDYLIVGGGIVGVSLAYFLSLKTKKRITLIEGGTIASGATGRAAGLFTASCELNLQDYIQLLGKESGIAYWKDLLATIHLVKHIIEKENISCDLEPQETVFGSVHEDHAQTILNEYEISQSAHIQSSYLAKEKVEHLLGTDVFNNALITPSAYSVNPLAFTQGLAHVVAKRGVSIYENTMALSIQNGHVTTTSGSIEYSTCIQATDFSLRDDGIHSVQSTILVSTPLSKKELASVNLTDKKMIWDTKKEYNYLKVTKDNRLLAGYGDTQIAEYKKVHVPLPAHEKKINSFIKKIFPKVPIMWEYGWSAPMGVTATKLPKITKTKHLITIGGVSGQIVGMTEARLLAETLAL